MHYKTTYIRDSQQHLNSNASRQSFAEPQFKTVNIHELQFQISQYQNESDIKESSFVIETSISQQLPRQSVQKQNSYPRQIKDSPVEKNRKQLIKDFLGDLPKADPNSLEEELHKIQNIQQVKKQSEQFILKFNKKSFPAVEELIQKFKKQKTSISHQTKNDAIRTAFKKKSNKIYQPEDPIPENQNQQRIYKEIAQYLLKMEGLDKTALGEYFGKNDKKVLLILHQYCSLLDFRKKHFDQALRDLLSKFRLPGESQQIQRIIWQFSQSFYEQNKNAADNPDQLFPLAYSIIMLATDAHNPKQEKKMSVDEFVKNTQRACPSTKQDYLKKIYQRISQKKLETSVSNWELGYGRLKDMNPLQQSKDYESHVKQLKQGLVMLKVCRQNPRFLFSNPKQCKFVQRKVYLSENMQRLQWIKDPPKENEEPRLIEINDVIDLTLGIDAQMLKQNKVPIEFDSVFFTIKTHHRTLHLKAKSTKQRSILINYLRVVMIKKRQERVQDEQEKQKQILSNKAIEEAWNQDIFPHWDRYWDYTLKRPKRKSYFARGIEVLCGCFHSYYRKQQEQAEEQQHELGIPIKNNLLQTLWKYGLPPKGRRILWTQMIGNPLELNEILVDDIRKRRVYSEKLRNFRIHGLIMKQFLQGKYNSRQRSNQKPLKKVQIQQRVTKIEESIYEITEYLLTIRPDLPHVKDLLLMAKVIFDVLEQDEQIQDQCQEAKRNSLGKKQEQITASTLLTNKNHRKYQIHQQKRTSFTQNNRPQQIVNLKPIVCLINLIHKHHFLAFYRGDKVGMRARFSLFDKLMQINAKSVWDHFEYIKLETKMYLVSWFLSVFSSCFEGQFLWRIWDNYLLEEELYLFKVGISIVKYFEIQLKMATFSQSLDLLKKPPQISPALFFKILQNEIEVDQRLYMQQIQSIKHGKIKDSVNQIPLQ